MWNDLKNENSLAARHIDEIVAARGTPGGGCPDSKGCKDRLTAAGPCLSRAGRGLTVLWGWENARDLQLPPEMGKWGR